MKRHVLTLVIIFICISCLQATTYYVSTNGSDNRSGTSESQAWGTFSHAISRMSAGDILIILDGMYNQSLSVSRSGSSSSPITIRAKNDGEVIIDGQNNRRPASISSSYIIIEGIIFQNSSGNVVTVTGSYNIFRRISAYNANPNTNSHIWLENRCSKNLYEDCVAAGSGRVCFEPFKSNGSIYRRCYARMGRGPSGMYHTGFQPYGASNILCENCIFEYEEGTTPAPGPSITNTDNEPMNPEDNIVLSSIIRDFTGIVDGGQGAEKFYMIQNSVNIRPRHYGASIRTGAAEIKISNFVVVDAPTAVTSDNFRNHSNPSHIEITNSVFIDNNMALGAYDGTTQLVKYCNFYNNSSNFASAVSQGAGNLFINPGYDVLKYGDGAYLMYAPNLLGKGEGGQNMGADIRFCSVNGKLTNTPLWPWPMESRIVNEIGVSVTWAANGGIWKTLNNVYDNNTPMPMFFVAIIATPTSGGYPLTVNFQGNLTNGSSPYSFLWDFGDGNTSNQQNPTHTYNSTGSFSIRLTVTDNNGEQATSTITIKVTDLNQGLSVRDTKLTEVGQTQALDRIQKEKWYDLYVYFNAPNGWSEIAYADVWLSSSSYTEGTIYNRGGIHYADKNYVMSFSMASVGIWAKENEGTQNWSNITGNLGKYVDDRYNIFEINNVDGWAKARIKLLSDTKVGNWSVNAYVKSKDGVNSTLYKKEFNCYDFNNGLTSVQLASFEADLNDKTVQLTWQTTTETNNIEFEIERRCDNEQFRKIGIVSGHYTNNEQTKYQFLDETIEKQKYYFYRLKLINMDGTSQYSSIVEIFTEVPKQFNLQQNYPNPFNPSTEICYSIPYTTDVYLAIFNPLGQHIVTLIQERQSPGQRTIKWDGCDKNGEEVSGGLYGYQLKAENFTAFKKMILIR